MTGRTRMRGAERALRPPGSGIEHDRSTVAEAVRQEFIAHWGSIDANPGEGEARRLAHHDLHRRALQAARQAVLAMRASEEIGDDAFHQLEEELDWIEMSGGGKEDGETYTPPFVPMRASGARVSDCNRLH